MAGRDFGRDDEACYLERLLACALVVAGDAKENRDRLRAVDLKELANLGTFAEALMQIAQDRAHSSGFRRFVGNLPVDDFAPAGRVDRLELLRVDEDGAEGHAQEQCECGQIACRTGHAITSMRCKKIGNYLSCVRKPKNDSCKGKLIGRTVFWKVV